MSDGIAYHFISFLFPAFRLSLVDFAVSVVRRLRLRLRLRPLGSTSSPSSSENLRFDTKKQIYDLPINQSSDDDAEPVQADGLPLLRVGHDPHLWRDGCLLGPSPLLLLAGTLITESNLQIPSFKSLSHTHATETPFLMDFSATSWCAKPPQTS